MKLFKILNEKVLRKKEIDELNNRIHILNTILNKMSRDYHSRCPEIHRLAITPEALIARYEMGGRT